MTRRRTCFGFCVSVMCPYPSRHNVKSTKVTVYSSQYALQFQLVRVQMAEEQHNRRLQGLSADMQTNSENHGGQSVHSPSEQTLRLLLERWYTVQGPYFELCRVSREHGGCVRLRELYVPSPHSPLERIIAENHDRSRYKSFGGRL